MPTDDSAGAAPREPSPPLRETPGAPLVVHARLICTVAAPSPASIKPYKQAMVVYGYRIERVEEGAAPPSDQIAVAHWAVREEKPVVLNRRVGDSCRMRLDKYADHPEWEGERQIIDERMLEWPLYIEVENAPTNSPGTAEGT